MTELVGTTCPPYATVGSKEITPCTSDEDCEHWWQVRIAVIPYERTQSVAELRAGDTPERLLLLARDGGTVVGHGLVHRSDSAGAAGASAQRCPSAWLRTSPSWA